MIGIHPSLPARNLKELLALARSQPGKLNFASSGNGGLPHLAIELFKKLGKVNVGARAVQGSGRRCRIDRRTRARDDHRLAGRFTAREKREAARDRHHGGEAHACCRTSRRRSSRASRADRRELVRDHGACENAQGNRQRLYGALAQTANAPDVKEQLRAQGVEAFFKVRPMPSRHFCARSSKWEKVAKESGAVPTEGTTCSACSPGASALCRCAIA